MLQLSKDSDPVEFSQAENLIELIASCCDWLEPDDIDNQLLELR